MDCLIGHDLSYRYQSTPVLRRARVTVRPGRATVLIGPSGSGKSTLIWLMAGLFEPSEGEVRLGDPASPQASRPVDYRRTRFGMVFQQGGLWDHLTAEEHLELVLTALDLSPAERRRRIDALLARLDIHRLRRRRPGRLSGGERRRLALARALVVEPEWLMLDEPLTHLDGPTRSDFFELLREVLRETQAGVLIATHNPVEALRLADEVTVLLDGRVVQSGAAEEVYRRPASLEVATVLGPADQVTGQAVGGRLQRDGVTIMAALDPRQAGPLQLIVRPHDLEFEPHEDGAATVARFDLTPGGYHLLVTVGDLRLTVLSRRLFPPGTRGELRLL